MSGYQNFEDAKVVTLTRLNFLCWLQTAVLFSGSIFSEITWTARWPFWNYVVYLV